MNDVYEMPASEWLSKGRPNEITENGQTYILYDYAQACQNGGE